VPHIGEIEIQQRTVGLTALRCERIEETERI
jgi:hypothetical protein